MAFIEYKNFRKFEKYMNSLNGQFVSPGGAAKMLEVPRQRIHSWVKRENWINAHKYTGPHGEFIIIPLKELENENIQSFLLKKRQMEIET